MCLLKRLAEKRSWNFVGEIDKWPTYLKIIGSFLGPHTAFQNLLFWRQKKDEAPRILAVSNGMVQQFWCTLNTWHWADHHRNHHSHKMCHDTKPRQWHHTAPHSNWAVTTLPPFLNHWCLYTTPPFVTISGLSPTHKTLANFCAGQKTSTRPYSKQSKKYLSVVLLINIQCSCTLQC